MSLLDDLIRETDAIVKGKWTRRDGDVIPKTEDVGLDKDGVDLEATFLYADLADSTELAINNQTIAAEIVKAYLMGTTRIIRELGGHIRSFDGDRVMGVFFKDMPNTHAAEAALKINFFFDAVLSTAFKKSYPTLSLSQTVGIDTSKVTVVRTGIRRNNDLVWIGRAPNVAAKLSSIREPGYSSYISETVFLKLHDDSKISRFNATPGMLMWEAMNWTDGTKYGVAKIFKSRWWWRP